MNWHHAAGTGNWEHFPHEALGDVFRATEEWSSELAGIDKPWLCWCVHDDWCVLQQKLVKACGWTPVVGTDGRCVQPTLIPKAVFVDFNRRLNLPSMWLHVPIEFVFSFCDRLAFWHADLLPPVSIMQAVVRQFESIEDGEYMGVRSNPTLSDRFRRLIKGVRRRNLWYRIRNNGAKRWFEVLGCTTAGASRSQYASGSGWWRHIERHPNATKRMKRRKPHYDHGVGIWYWEKQFGGSVRELPVNVDPYHYASKRKKQIVQGGHRNKQLEMTHQYDLPQIASTLGLDDFPTSFSVYASRRESTKRGPN